MSRLESVHEPDERENFLFKFKPDTHNK